MFVEYNGVSLTFERILQWDDSNVYTEDGTERLYRHVRMTAQFVIHPKTISDLGLGNVQSAAEMAYYLKQRLLTPRRRLRVTIGKTLVLASPPPVAIPGIGLPADNEGGLETTYVDARTGPNPLHCNVAAVHGEKTFMGTFSIETWLVEDHPTNARASSALIAHRWECKNDIDQDFYTTRVVSGRAVFRGDFLYERTNRGDMRQLKRRPADYFAYLAPLLPPGYKRVSVNTSVSGDGLSCSYTVVDREQPAWVNPNLKWISRVEGAWRSGHFKPQGNWGTGYFYFASSYTSLVVRAWGKPGCPRQQLINACLKAVASFGFAPELRLAWNNFKTDLTVDLFNRFAELSVGVTIQGMQGTLTGLGGIDVNTTLGPIVRSFPDDVPYRQGKGDILQGSGAPPEGQAPVEGIYGPLQYQTRTQSLRDGYQVPSPTPLLESQTLATARADSGDKDAASAAASAGDSDRRD